MTHKADAEFFERKRQWSRRKDEILRCYLSAYLPKIMTLRKPVLIVDGFAGPGRFDDDGCGSPLIICECVEHALATNLRSQQPVEFICVEKVPKLFSALAENLKPFSFAHAKQGRFSDYAADISVATKSKSVFLYADPFTVEGLVWDELDRIFRGLSSGNSVEILLNLNAASFIRRGLAALSTKLDAMEDEDSDPVDTECVGKPQLETLDSVVGGPWWRDLVARGRSFPETASEFTRLFCEQMKARFKEVASHPIKTQPHHTVPKYYLVFGTRHIDGLALMNDEMVKSRRALADMAKPKERTLFETRSEELVPDLERLPALILRAAATRSKRKDVINKVVRGAFCDFHRSEIRGCVERLLNSGELQSATGKTRINDDVHVWASASRNRTQCSPKV